MSMSTRTDGEKRAYQQGYQRGLRRSWPGHGPVYPPEQAVREIMEAAKELRQGIDGLLASFGEDDEANVELSPKIERVDKALEAVTTWLIEGSVTAQGSQPE